MTTPIEFNEAQRAAIAGSFDGLRAVDLMHFLETLATAIIDSIEATEIKLLRLGAFSVPQAKKIAPMYECPVDEEHASLTASLAKERDRLARVRQLHKAIRTAESKAGAIDIVAAVARRHPYA